MKKYFIYLFLKKFCVKYIFLDSGFYYLIKKKKKNHHLIFYLDSLLNWNKILRIKNKINWINTTLV